MVRKYSLSWSLKASALGGAERCTEWFRVQEMLDKARIESGTVTLTIIDGPGKGAIDLQARCDRSNYLLTLGEDNGKEYFVRSYTNAASTGDVEILGDMWDAKMVFYDFTIVIRAFEEFFRTGDVSSDLLSE